MIYRRLQPNPSRHSKKLKSRKQGARSELLYSFCWSQIFPRSQVLKMKLMLNMLLQHYNGLAHEHEHVDLKGTNKPFDIEIWLIYMVYRFNFNNLVTDSIINSFIWDWKGKANVLHYIYFLYVILLAKHIFYTSIIFCVCFHKVMGSIALLHVETYLLHTTTLNMVPFAQWYILATFRPDFSFPFLTYGMRISELKNARLRYSRVLKCSSYES